MSEPKDKPKMDYLESARYYLRCDLEAGLISGLPKNNFTPKLGLLLKNSSISAALAQPSEPVTLLQILTSIDTVLKVLPSVFPLIE